MWGTSITAEDKRMINSIIFFFSWLNFRFYVYAEDAMISWLINLLLAKATKPGPCFIFGCISAPPFTSIFYLHRSSLELITVLASHCQKLNWAGESWNGRCWKGQAKAKVSSPSFHTHHSPIGKRRKPEKLPLSPTSPSTFHHLMTWIKDKVD